MTKRATTFHPSSPLAWQRVVEMSTDLAVVVDAEATLLWVSPTAHEIAGYAPHEVIGVDGFAFVHPADLAQVAAYFATAVATPGRHPPIEFRIRAKDGGWVWIEERLTNLLDDPDVRGLVAYLRDITDRRDLLSQLQLREQRYRAIVDTADEGIGIIDSTGTIVFANRQLSDLVGRPDVEGTTVLDHVDATDVGRVALRLRSELVATERFAVRLRHASGRLIYGGVAMIPFEQDADGGPTALIMVRDDTAQRSYEHELSHATMHDALTGLPNRQMLNQHLTEMCAQLAPGRRGGLFVVDVDRFSALNTSLGPQAGDAVLAAIAMRLVELAAPGDLVARIGNDQFAVVTASTGTGLQARQTGKRLIAGVSEPVDVGQERLLLTACVGVTLTDGSDADAALARAMAALESAKASGRSQMRLDDGDDQPVALEAWRLESELRAAVDTDEFFVVYQPVVDLSDGEFVGAEALLRWTSPLRGPVPPDQFIPIAEEADLIESLGQRVLSVACRDAATWPRRDDGSRRSLSVNVSAKQLKPSLTATVLLAIQEAGLDPSNVVLEVTETSLLADVEAAATALTQLRDVGVRVHIDDFGTGYASMLYLRQFPVDAVKLDRQFVAGLGTSDEDAAIVTATLSMARAMQRAVVAEGVETDQQAEFLRAAGCDLAQGYLWSRPLTQDEWLTLQENSSHVGSRLNRAPTTQDPDPAAVARITELHSRGTSSASIAAALNREGVLSPRGSRWHRASVEALVAQLLHRRPASTGTTDSQPSR